MIHNIYSTLPSFKNLNDLKPGLNVLLAQKTVGATSKQTRNRAGKTSLIEVVHFLMGAKAEPDAIFRTPELEGETFGMSFDLLGAPTTVERCGSNKSKVTIRGTGTEHSKIAHSDWLASLGERMFGLGSLDAAGRNPPSFRSVFPYFVRRQSSGAFTTPEKHATQQQAGDMQSALMFLLGLDWQIARDWQAVRDREKTLKELKDAAGAGVLGNIIGKAADLRTQLTLQEARSKKLAAEIANFQVLPEYKELETESARLTVQLNDLANANTLDLHAIA